MLLFFGCRGVEGSVRFPLPSLPPHSGISIPRLTNISTTQAIKLGNFTSKSCRGHKRNVSKFVMRLQTETLFGFFNQSPFLSVLVAVAFADEKAHLSYSAICMLRERTVFRGTRRTSLKWFTLSPALALETCLINLSPHVRECMTVLDSGFHAVDSGFQLLDSGFQLSGFQIPEGRRGGFP